MISSEGRYCSNRVLMLKGCCHYLRAEGAVTVKCTFTGSSRKYTLTDRKSLTLSISLWLSVYRGVDAVDQKARKFPPLSHWFCSLPFICSALWIHLNELLRTCLCFLICFRFYEHCLPAQGRSCLLTNFCSYFRGWIFTTNHCVSFADMLSVGSPSA